MDYGRCFNLHNWNYWTCWQWNFSMDILATTCTSHFSQLATRFGNIWHGKTIHYPKELHIERNTFEIWKQAWSKGLKGSNGIKSLKGLKKLKIGLRALSKLRESNEALKSLIFAKYKRPFNLITSGSKTFAPKLAKDRIFGNMYSTW